MITQYANELDAPGLSFDIKHLIYVQFIHT